MDGCLSLMYRGPLASCNYGCGYCPFAKHHETAAELAVDRSKLERFVDWVESRSQGTYDVFFTPWGEALTRRWYCEAICRLSWLPRVRRVAVQTNLSADLDWLREVCRNRVALWSTYHPGEVTRSQFLQQCRRLDELQIGYSVGVVGLREHFAEIEGIRSDLASDVYIWVNAYKDEKGYYTPADERFLTAIDPLFPVNNTNHASRGRVCQTGESVVSVDGDGNVRRCHFVPTLIGNLYDPDFSNCLQPRLCPNATCDCHIGYVHLSHLGLDEVFREGILERIPAAFRTIS
jgi:MoaA/NifB/PqqE/SkfB family radical SAM enzyme